MATKINKKKVVGTCPVGMRKTVCPSIKKTRQIRTKLFALRRESNVNTNQLTEFRTALKERKRRGIAVDCETCSFNTPTSAPNTQ